MANALGNLVIDRINKVCFFDSDTGELIWTLNEPTEVSLSQKRETVLSVRRENEEIDTE